MSLPPLPQFNDMYEGSKQRYLIQILETSFVDLSRLQALSAKIPIIQTNAATEGNTGSAETTLYTFPVSTRNIKGATWEIYVTAFGSFASTNNTKELKLYLNNSVIYDSGAFAANGGTWKIETIIVWNGISAQKNITTSISSNGTFPTTVVYTTSSELFDAPTTVTLTAIGQATNDIVAQTMIVTTQAN